MIDFRQVRQAEALENVEYLASVLRVVQNDMDDRPGVGWVPFEVIDERLVQALLAMQPAGERGKGH